jgi:hypothetical protein
LFGFLAHKGSGKSTTAAALHARGYPLVTDDVFPVATDDPRGLMGYPGYPQMKLWPDAARASLGEDPELLARLHSRVEKRIRLSREGFPKEPLPIRRLYVLEQGPVPEIEAVPPREAFAHLVRHSYVNRLLQKMETSAAHFNQCVKLLNYVPVLRLKRPQDLSTLPRVVQLLEEDMISGLDPAGRGSAQHPLRRDVRTLGE